MRREHLPAFVAFGGVVVDYLRVGQEHGLTNPVQAADQVEVLEVHEKTVVKEDAVRRNRGEPHEHEAPAQARRVHRPVVPRIHEAVAGVLLLLPFLQEADGRDEAAEDEVGRRGEQLAQVLRRAVRVDDFRQDVHRAGIPVHVSRERREHARLEADVGVQDDVIFRPHLDREAHRKVVRAAVAEVLVVDVADFFRATLKLPPAVIGRVVNDDDMTTFLWTISVKTQSVNVVKLFIETGEPRLDERNTMSNCIAKLILKILKKSDAKKVCANDL